MISVKFEATYSLAKAVADAPKHEHQELYCRGEVEEGGSPRVAQGAEIYIHD